MKEGSKGHSPTLLHGGRSHLEPRGNIPWIWGEGNARYAPRCPKQCHPRWLHAANTSCGPISCAKHLCFILVTPLYLPLQTNKHPNQNKHTQPYSCTWSAPNSQQQCHSTDTQQLVDPTVGTTRSNTPQQPLPMALGTTALWSWVHSEPRPAAPTLQPRALPGVSLPTSAGCRRTAHTLLFLGSCTRGCSDHRHAALGWWGRAARRKRGGGGISEERAAKSRARGAEGAPAPTRGVAEEKGERDGRWQLGKKAPAPSTKVSICQSSAPSQSSRLWLSAGQTRPAPGQAPLLKHIRGSREASLLLIYICKSSCLANTDEERRDGKAEPILRCFLEARRGNLSAPRQQHRVQQLLLLWTLS